MNEIKKMMNEMKKKNEMKWNEKKKFWKRNFWKKDEGKMVFKFFRNIFKICDINFVGKREKKRKKEEKIFK